MRQDGMVQMVIYRGYYMSAPIVADIEDLT